MSAPSTLNGQSPHIEVGVIMRRERVNGPMSRWQSFRWVLADVIPQSDWPVTPALDNTRGPIPVEVDGPSDEDASHWFYPGFKVSLYRDDVEGYRLNMDSPRPCFWVMWRLDNELSDDTMPQPEIVTLSYHDAGRWLDAQERVDQVPAPVWVQQWLVSFIEQHYVPEPKRRKTPSSVQALADRFGNPARITTEKIRGGSGHGG